MAFIGIEIGGTKLQIAVGEANTARIKKMYRADVDKARGAEGILSKIESIIDQLDEKPEAIGVGFGGPLDRLTGRIATSHQIGGWSGFDMKAWFQQRYAVPVFLENDANTAALAEALHGAGKDYRYVFYITLGSGVGGGMVSDKKLYHGDAPGEAEVGLMAMDREGTTLESMCSGWALDAKIRNGTQHLADGSALKTLIGNVSSGQWKARRGRCTKRAITMHNVAAAMRTCSG